jgi:hypothetical protein
MLRAAVSVVPMTRTFGSYLRLCDFRRAHRLLMSAQSPGMEKRRAARNVRIEAVHRSTDRCFNAPASSGWASRAEALAKAGV